MSKQVIIIGGGTTFATREQYLDYLKNCPVSLESFLAKKDWKSNLAKDLGENFEVLEPRMPDRNNAQYEEWGIWFERMIPFIKDGVILIGHSLGGTFLVKYLAENKFPAKISKLILVAAPYSHTLDLVTFSLGKDLQNVWKQCQNIHIFQSEDDLVVPLQDAQSYLKEFPQAKLHLFKDRGHFNQEEFSELAELVRAKE